MRLAPLALAALLGTAALAPLAEAQTATALFTGFQAQSNDPVQVDAQTLEIFEEGKERIAVFNGNVVVTRGDTTLRAASIRLHQDLQGKTDAFTRIEAEGGIVVRQKDQMLTGKAAVVDMTQNSIVVTGGVELSQGINKLTGNRLVVDLKTGRARVEGGGESGVRGVFTPAGP